MIPIRDVLILRNPSFFLSCFSLSYLHIIQSFDVCRRLVYQVLPLGVDEFLREWGREQGGCV